MRRWAFIIAILGMFVLALLMNLPVREVDSYEEISGLEINTRVKISGEITSERVIYEDEKLLTLDNGVDLIYQGGGGFNGEEVEVIGLVSEYEGKKQITVEKIAVLG